MASWLDDFVEYASHGESPPKYLFWTGVATIAGALRRKVWIQEHGFQWTPNFYILLVGPPGGPKKTTSINFGMNFLGRVEGINFGPSDLTWQQLITHMADSRMIYKIGDADFEASCVTVAIDEFGTFFDPAERKLVDSMTSLWDSKLGVYRKETKTQGCDEIVNPWLNIIAGTTPGWLADNFNSKLLRSGFASRPVFLYEEEPVKNVAYPSQQVPDCSRQGMLEESLMSRLREYAEYSGPFVMSPEAYEWGVEWYGRYKVQQAAMEDKREAAFYERKQTHLHKLAMILCVARGDFPLIKPEHLIEADARLTALDPDIRTIFGFVGQTRMSQAASEMWEIVRKTGAIKKKDVYRKYFFRTMDSTEFETALKSIVASGYVELVGPLDDLTIRAKGK